MRLPGVQHCLVLYLASDSKALAEVVRVDGLEEAPHVYPGDYAAGPMAVLSRYPRFPLMELLKAAPDWRWMSEAEIAQYSLPERRDMGRQVA